jgi:hypothetical protein
MSENLGEPSAKDVGAEILGQLKADLGSAWDARLTPAERELLTQASSDAASVLLIALAGRASDASRERAHIDAQLLNLTSIEASRMSRQLWVAVDRAARRAIVLALGLV